MKRKTRFGLLLSPRERRALAWLAQIEGGLSEAATLRRLIYKEARARGLYNDQEQPGRLTIQDAKKQVSDGKEQELAA